VPTTVEKAEQFSIRFAGHIGEVPPPVDGQHGSFAAG